ncbi:uncharacterized protein LOC116308859 [Actinia tenebrosa]|uniref:Uncharacterized protein LOC116308859 n=1 Tax=Actinia tenebrosa TaxID=6105 RepID=A0A6P8J559_ACTTE|nr:uncharacterized protein LOC116308859 [Actinia tenebrosa]
MVPIPKSEILPSNDTTTETPNLSPISCTESVSSQKRKSSFSSTDSLAVSPFSPSACTAHKGKTPYLFADFHMSPVSSTESTFCGDLFEEEEDSNLFEGFHMSPISSATSCYSEETDNTKDKLGLVLPSPSLCKTNKKASISTATLSVLGSTDVEDSGLFVETLPDRATFALSPSEWLSITPKDLPSGGRRLTGSWADLFSKKIKESNPFCSFRFKAPRREQLKTELEANTPSRFYHQHLANLEPQVFGSGNRDGVGSIGVLRKISAEAKTKHEIDRDLITSLLRLKQTLRQQDVTKAEAIGTNHAKGRKILGYVQYVSLDPFTIMLWTEAGVRLWHDLASTTTIHWDATGSLVKKCVGEGNVYYYAIVLPHPTAGQPPLAVAEMITNSHNVPNVTHFLSLFRYAEKVVFGYRQLKVPLRFESDLSLTFILTSLWVINGETMRDFLLRAWRISIKQPKAGDSSKMNPHACTSHVMHDIGIKFKKLCSNDVFVFSMHCFALLVNSSNLDEAEGIITNLNSVLTSPTASKFAVSAYQWLHHRLSQQGCPQADTGCLKDTALEKLLSPAHEDDPPKNEDSASSDEEQFNFESPGSPFKKHFHDLLTKQKVVIELHAKTTDKKNRFHAPEVMDVILKHRIPTLPLWSGLMKGIEHSKDQCVTKEGKKTSYCEVMSKSSRSTNAVCENWFKLVKVDDFLRKSHFRPDVFVMQQYSHILGRQRLFTESYLTSSNEKEHLSRSQKKRVSRALNDPAIDDDKQPNDVLHNLVEEKWGKRKRTNNVNKVGRFQRPPQKGLPQTLEDESINLSTKTTAKERKKQIRSRSASPKGTPNVLKKKRRCRSPSPKTNKTNVAGDEQKGSSRSPSPEPTTPINVAGDEQNGRSRSPSPTATEINVANDEQKSSTSPTSATRHACTPRVQKRRRTRKQRKTTAKNAKGGALFRRAIADRKGIKNLGSTCYLSATLQMLVRDPVTDSIIEHSRNESSKSPASTDSDCLIVESVFQTQLAKDVQ